MSDLDEMLMKEARSKATGLDIGSIIGVATARFPGKDTATVEIDVVLTSRLEWFAAATVIAEESK